MPKKHRQKAAPKSTGGGPQQEVDRQLNILRYEQYETVKVWPSDRQYYVETDRDFVTDVSKIAKLRRNVLQDILDEHKQKLSDEQCDEIDYQARLHRQANVVNQNSKRDFDSVELSKQCHCGCRRARGEPIPLCADEQQLHILGPGIILQFLYMKAIAAVLVLAIIIYAIFALVINLLGSSADTDTCASDTFCEYKHNASEENKGNEPTVFSVVQMWLGFLLCFVWIFLIKIIKLVGREKNRLVDEGLGSASDYTVKMENLPRGSYHEYELMEFLEAVWSKLQVKYLAGKTSRQIREAQGGDSNHFGIKSIQIIYDMQFARTMVDEVFGLCDRLESLLLMPDLENEKKYIREIDEYRRSKAKLKEVYEMFLDLRKMFINEPKFRKNISTTCCLVELRSSSMKELLLAYYGREKAGLFSQVYEKISRLLGSKGSDLIFKGSAVDIQRAPEPSDLLWTNCERPFSVSRKLIIYFITFLIVIVSFGIQMTLEYFQRAVKQDQANTDQENNMKLTVLNYAMSVGLLLVNEFLWWSLFYLLDLEYNHTLTDKIISQMNKVMFVASINSIVLPILTTEIYAVIDGKNNLYASDGLSAMVFDYHISMVVGIFGGLFDPLNLIRRVVLEVKIARNIVIRFLSRKLLRVDTQKGVKEVNQFYEENYFDVAGNYVYVMSALLHAAFYCYLQPSILIVVTGMIVIYYFVHRMKLLRMCKIPQLTELLVFETALMHAGLVPIFYGVGTISISYLEQQINPNKDIVSYLPSGIAIAIGTFGFLNPCGVITCIVGTIMRKCKCLRSEQLIAVEAIERVEENLGKNESELQIGNVGLVVGSESGMKTGSTEGLFGRLDQSKTTRIQVYYENSNALTLFGFEKILRGEPEKQVMSELRSFCESFLSPLQENNELLRFTAAAMNQCDPHMIATSSVKGGTGFWGAKGKEQRLGKESIGIKSVIKQDREFSLMELREPEQAASQSQFKQEQEGR